MTWEDRGCLDPEVECVLNEVAGSADSCLTRLFRSTDFARIYARTSPATTDPRPASQALDRVEAVHRGRTLRRRFVRAFFARTRRPGRFPGRFAPTLDGKLRLHVRAPHVETVPLATLARAAHSADPCDASRLHSALAQLVSGDRCGAAAAYGRLLAETNAPETRAYAWTNLGLLHELSGRTPDSFDAYARAADLQPTWHAPALSGLFQAVQLGREASIRRFTAHVNALFDPDDPHLARSVSASRVQGVVNELAL